MLSKRLEDAINAQINAELYSAYLYLSMAQYFESIGLKGFANWMNVQFQEEQYHAFKFVDYINERGGRVFLKTIEQPKTVWGSPLEVMEDTLKHEEKVTSLINNLIDLSIEEKDHMTTNFLQWYIAEQVEEESNDKEIIDKIKLVGDRGNGMFMLDKELGTRVFTPPTKEV
ncbi:MAG TPA: ferritin [Bacteroidetes bacterium]|uniref:Ferritin n=1 Tax=candidate division TA06 bacterium TaxID=2250710 RepID=A0A660SA79_UNCT6|nr:MAG: ferritin [candidate division TA06 bacterium]HHD82785.1 ferritin [Bacteroidota bacterium]